MRVAVVGATGTLGALVTSELTRRGHEVRSLSRKSPDYPVDLSTGQGLAEALTGCAVVVDASNDPSGSREILVEGCKRLLAAEQEAAVGHHICVSIVGCDRMQVGYYKVKLWQEGVVEEATVPWSIVRATQFHELIAATFARASKLGVMPVPRAQLQPVACADVAAEVALVAEGEPLGARREIAGPEVTDARVMARQWRSESHRHVLLAPIHLPGKLGRALRSGLLTAIEPDVLGTITFADWLAAVRARTAIRRTIV
jgi:uncharacterized protein YbjT (DUF2867 family)